MEELRKFGPRPKTDGRICPACNKPFKQGEFSTLIALGPSDDVEEQEKMRQGKEYKAVAVEVHWACATGEY